MLYHGTFRKNLDGIKKFGLKSMPIKNWKDCTNGVVCLEKDPFAAESYCEVAADFSEDDTLCEEDIIVLGIKENELDLINYKLIPDPDINLSEGVEITSFAYTGTISANKLYVITANNFNLQNHGNLIDLKEIPKFN